MKKKGFQFLLCYEGLMMEEGAQWSHTLGTGKQEEQLPRAAGVAAEARTARKLRAAASSTESEGAAERGS